MNLSTDSPFRNRTRATCSLPGDILEVLQNLPATTRGGQTRRLATGLYVLLGQRDNALVLARAAEDEEDQICAAGPCYGVPVQVLETDAVRATGIRAAY